MTKTNEDTWRRQNLFDRAMICGYWPANMTVDQIDAVKEVLRPLPEHVSDEVLDLLLDVPMTVEKHITQECGLTREESMELRMDLIPDEGYLRGLFFVLAENRFELSSEKFRVAVKKLLRWAEEPLDYWPYYLIEYLYVFRGTYIHSPSFFQREPFCVSGTSCSIGYTVLNLNKERYFRHHTYQNSLDFEEELNEFATRFIPFIKREPVTARERRIVKDLIESWWEDWYIDGQQDKMEDFLAFHESELH